MRSLKPNESEDFYFRDQQSLVAEDGPTTNHNAIGGSAGNRSSHGGGGGHQQSSFFCRLCQEDVVPPFTPRAHILASSRTTHTNHSCRETVLDTLVLVLARGYPVDKMLSVWANLLFNHPRGTFPRIAALSNPDWSLAQRGEQLLGLLQLLTDVGVIDIAYAAVGSDDPTQQTVMHRRRVAMERTEIIGDNSWGHHMSHRMMALFPDRQFLYSQFAYSYNCFRDACEMNVTLEWIYDVLQISMLFPVSVRERIGNGKVKADILEAILGELHLNLFGFIPQIHDVMPFVEVNGCGERLLSSIIEHVMTEIFDMIILHFVGELLGTAIPLAKEIAAPMLWRTARSQLTKHKDRTGSLRRRNLCAQVGRVVNLPAPMGVHSAPTAAPSAAPHPLRHPSYQLPETTVAFNGQDTLEDLLPHLNSAHASENFLETGVVEAIRAERINWTSMREALQLNIVGDAPLLGVDVEELYFRDPYFNLCSVPQQRSGSGMQATIIANRPETFDAAGVAYPRLQATPVASGDTNAVRDDTKNSSSAVCYFYTSRFVPSDVKPPAAGVVTDKNLHPGTFLFAAFPSFRSPASSILRDDPTISVGSDGKSSTTSTNEEASGGNAALSTQSNNTMESLIEQWRLRCSAESECFPALLHGVKLPSKPPTGGDGARDGGGLEHSQPVVAEMTA